MSEMRPEYATEIRARGAYATCRIRGPSCKTKLLVRRISINAMKYCPRCRSELQPQSIDGRTRLACPATGCGFVYWNNPIPVVAGLVKLGDQYLLARNSAWPPALFSILTGFLDEGEAPEAAVMREIREELGVQTEGIDFIGLFPLPRNNQLIIAYVLHTTGEPVLSNEIDEIKLLSPDQLATFNFGPLELTRDIVLKWLHRSAVPGAEQAVAAVRDR